MLTAANFDAFFEEVHRHEPFPWQKRLLRQIASDGSWPNVLDLPTGSGKTAAIDIAVFYLALEADRGSQRRAPVRIAFVVDRRLVVDDAFSRVDKLASALVNARAGSITARVAERLRRLSGDGPPLIARRLRGGVPRESDWARTPAQPTVLCSTVDQIGSRLLFRGYGVTDSMKPVHAGLLGSDCLILLDEAHLAEPFRQTVEWVQVYRGENWREACAHAVPAGIALLTATPGQQPPGSFSLGDEDKAHPILRARLEAPKPVHLVTLDKSNVKQDEAAEADEDEGRISKDLGPRIAAIVRAVSAAFEHFEKAEKGALRPAVGIVVNRVARARKVFERLSEEYENEIAAEQLDVTLMIGPARPLDREVLGKSLEPIRTRTWNKGEARELKKPLVLVATQCIEAGVDIDFDALITEAAPLDALRQRFGRLNRAGRRIEPYAAIVAGKSDISARQEDPVYGKAIKPTWDYLRRAAKAGGCVDFKISAMHALMQEAPPPGEVLTPKADAPILLPAHLDLLSQTSPIPTADPDIALYLHGPDRQPDSLTVIWRADIEPDVHENENENVRRLLTLVPPRSAEAIELPIWAVRRWLEKDEKVLDRLADIASSEPKEDLPVRVGRQAFRWRGDKDESGWITPAKLRPGDVVVVPAGYGGLDKYGWNPGARQPVEDVAQEAAAPFASRRFAVRVAPGLLVQRGPDETPLEIADREQKQAEALADALSAIASAHWRDVRDVLLTLGLPEALRRDLERLDHAKKATVFFDVELYGEDDRCPRGIVFVAPLGITKAALLKVQQDDAQPNVTEDDVSGSIPGFRQTLRDHSVQVERKANAFAETAGLPNARIKDLALAGFLHDAGKADHRFQAWLQYGDPLGPDPDRAEEVLAKSGRFLPKRARENSGLPPNWRHEAFSVRLALAHSRFDDANDPELVLWLVGVHHGYGRPFFPHSDAADDQSRALPAVLGLPRELPAGNGPQSLAFNYEGLDWHSLFMRLKSRYGVWELARMEAILRLADHRASEDAVGES